MVQKTALGTAPCPAEKVEDWHNGSKMGKTKGNIPEFQPLDQAALSFSEGLFWKARRLRVIHDLEESMTTSKISATGRMSAQRLHVPRLYANI